SAGEFSRDVVESARSLGRKYGYDARHAETVRRIALQLAEKLGKYYRIPARWQLLLSVAALLHDIGRFVDTRKHHRHSYYLVSNSQLPGITAAEQRVIAAVTRYHRQNEPRDSHPEYMVLNDEEKVAVLKLSAILRVADALDQAHSGRFVDMKLAIHGNELIVRLADPPDLEYESIQLQRKGGMFKNVFGLDICIQEEQRKL
ncbi:MAG: HD domain-containing protein, partial [Victivallaceae bacterium]|nr:HD domain-containing protein [Victivallaceae bacterium]